MVRDPDHPPDDLGHSVQGPELIAEAVGAGPFEVCSLDGSELLRPQPGSPPGPAGARQGGLPLLLPAAVPHAGGLDAHLQLSGDVGRSGSLGEERGRFEAAFVEGVEVSSRPQSDRG